MHQGKKEMMYKDWNQMIIPDFHNKLELEDLMLENKMLQKSEFSSIEMPRKR